MSETTQCGISVEEFEKFTRYMMADNGPDDELRAKIMGFHNHVLVAPGAVIRIGENPIGDNTFIGLYSYINGDVRIGKNVLIGPHCSLPAGNHRFSPETQAFNTLRDIPKTIIIGDGSWLASGVTITNGVTVGKGVLICANSVVTKDVPDFAIMAGTPAKQIGKVDSQTGEYCWFEK